jgi:hypothetical protein
LLKPIAHACPPSLGAIAFFGKSPTQITHVAFCVDTVTMVEAGGGDSSTIGNEVASMQNAFVRLRPTRFRKDFLFSVMPLYIKESPA